MPRPDRHREPILVAAQQSLRREGYAATSITDVLAVAGATNGSLYHHFPGGKLDLAVAALEASGAAIDDRLVAAFAGAPDPASAIQLWVRALIAQLQGDPRDGCPIAPAALEAGAADERLRQAAVGAFDRWTATLAAALGGDAAAERRARVLLAAIEGALLLDRTANSTAHLEALLPLVPAIVGG